MKRLTMKPLLLALGLSVVSMTAAGHLVANRTVLNNNDTATVTAKFPQPVAGDLYLATSINGTLFFFADQGKSLTKEVLPFQKNGTFSADIKVLDVSALGIPANQYPLYEVVVKPGTDPLIFTNWIGGLAGLHKMNFSIGLPSTHSNDKNGDGFADDDSDHDGYRDGDHNFDGKDDRCTTARNAKKESADDHNHAEDEDKVGDDSSCTTTPTSTPVPVTQVPTISPKPTVSPVPTTTPAPDICGSRLCLPTTTPTITVVPTTTSTPTPTPTAVVDTSLGKAKYVSLGCSASSCHKADPLLNTKKIRSGTSLQSLKNAIRSNPGDMGYLADTTDPQYASDADLTAIAAYLKSL